MTNTKELSEEQMAAIVQRMAKAATAAKYNVKLEAAYETVGGVPIGLSRDYDKLPRIGPIRSVCCSSCYRWYEDAPRLLPDGCRAMAGRCGECRERVRALWIAATRVVLPTAIARYREKESS